jgi:hypothetical protein
MATTTPNFGWAVPTSSDLVKNGAVAIETLGDAIDASLVDLKGGTTGQVLAKASGTDMDFSWATAGGGGSVAYGKTASNGANVATTSTSFTPISTTNLRITATPTGTTAVCVMSAFLTNSGVTISEWRVNAGAGTTHGFQAYNGTYEGTTILKTVSTVITGLTAGTSYNFDWEFKVNAGTTTIIGDTASVYPRFQVIC